MIGALVLGWLGTAGKALRAIPWPVYATAALLLGVWWYGHSRYESGLAEGRRIEHAEWKAALQAEAAKRTKAIEEAQRARAKRAQWIKAQFEREKQDAIDKAVAVERGLHTGALRLREHWQCPAGVPGDRTTGAAGPGAAGATGRREASAGRIVGVGAESDAFARRLQRELIACHAELEAVSKQTTAERVP